MIRRRLNKQQNNDDVEINVTPLLDIVFIMLIFFIVTANFVKETGVDINRPSAKTASAQVSATILIAVDSNNTIWINRRQVNIDSVRAYVERMHAETPQGGVVIQADKDSNNGTLVEIIDQIRLAGIEKIALAADAPKP
ncbi:MAG: ExbD/TolR family protein [Candidatus Oxydemutatoraceae bacterium WSBS_2016_MAG_OTU14]